MTFRSPIFELSHTYIDDEAALSPMGCTYLGNGLNQDKLDDFSIAGAAVSAELTRKTLKKLLELKPIDEIDRIAQTVMQERLESSLALHDSQESFVLWNVLTSPPSNVRSIFELMPKSTDKDFDNIAKRLAAVDGAYKSWTGAIMEVAKSGKTTAQRQVRGVIEQLNNYANGGFSAMSKNFDAAGKYPAIHENAKLAEKAAAETAEFLKNQYLPIATPEDAVGADRYAVWARYFTGAKLDLRATYEWGMADLKAINARMWEIAEQIKPGAKTLREVADHLDKDPKYVIKGKDNVVKFLQEFTDAAIARMDGEYFEIDDRIKICEARLAPEGSASAPYYNPPSEDLSRPGTTWIPMLGKDQVSSWHLVSTWYHEAVPGHHLQVATTKINTDRLNRFQRNRVWVSGYGEGWALYAETLGYDMGLFKDPYQRFGTLSDEMLRAMRLVVDTGIHSKGWTREQAIDYMLANSDMGKTDATAEVERYIAITSQALAYKIGALTILRLKDKAKKELGTKFDVREFHNQVLNTGALPLTVLEKKIDAWIAASK